MPRKQSSSFPVDFAKVGNRTFPCGERDHIVSFPDLTASQAKSYQWLFEDGIKEILKEFDPISDNTGRGWRLSFSDPRFGECTCTGDEAVKKGLTYATPWFLTVTLAKIPSEIESVDDLSKEERSKVETRDEEVYMGEIPAMTEQGTFIINGVEKAVVNQLTRSEGVFFVGEVDSISGRRFAGAKVLPKNGCWLQVETSKKGIISVRIDRKRKLPITALLRVYGLETDQDIRDAFLDVDTNPDISYIEATLEKDVSTHKDNAILEIYQRLRPGDPLIQKKAADVVKALLFDSRRYNLGRVGRFKINQRLGLTFPNEPTYYTLQLEDLLAIVKEIIRINNGLGEFDDIDHLGNRRVRQVGELVQQQMRHGFIQLIRVIRSRMGLQPRGELCSPRLLVSSRPVASKIRSFFSSGQLAQFQDQENALAGLDHLRRLSVVGPGGLTKERASFSVRDAHFTQYSRICPVRTPEGGNVGLITYLALYARINDLGFIEAPYRKLEKIEKNGKTKVKVTDEVEYLAAFDEDNYTVTTAIVEIDKDGFIVPERIPLRHKGDFTFGSASKADYMDVLPHQIIGASAGLIPFLANDAVNRSLVGSNQLNQAVPLVKPEAPLVGTGLEAAIAYNSGSMVMCEEDGTVEFVDGTKVAIKPKGDGKVKEYPLKKYRRTNQETCFDHRPIVNIGDKVTAGSALADGSSTDQGEMALGTNLRVAYMFFEGLGLEDALVISEEVAKRDALSSIHIVRYDVQVLETKLGPELLTADIPNVSEEVLRNLDEGGIVNVGAAVESGDILVGKIAPRGETELSAEERLLRAIFGEKAREVRDNSLRVPHGERGIVTSVHILDASQGDDLPVGVMKKVQVFVAQVRRIKAGDKLAGRHGNKGVVSVVLPSEDMPHFADGTPIDMIICPASVVSRMNVGQLMETHFGWTASKLNKKYAFPAFEILSPEVLSKELEEAGFPVSGKTKLFDGRTGEPFDQEIVVGYEYILKLKHMAEDKVHARSTGPYSLITQQPLGGKSQFGGQRFGEMEVWALEGYSAARTLQEMLTVKSDDLLGRTRVYRAIIKGEEFSETYVPESFKLLVRELNGLGLKLDPLINEEKEEEENA